MRRCWHLSGVGRREKGARGVCLAGGESHTALGSWRWASRSARRRWHLGRRETGGCAWCAGCAGCAPQAERAARGLGGLGARGRRGCKDLSGRFLATGRQTKRNCVPSTSVVSYSVTWAHPRRYLMTRLVFHQQQYQGAYLIAFFLNLRCISLIITGVPCTHNWLVLTDRERSCV